MFIQALCGYLNANVDPSAVVITGDLTDSKGADRFSSRLYKEEWVTYDRVMRGKACSQLNIFDIKVREEPRNLIRQRNVEMMMRDNKRTNHLQGNHDAFDLLDDDKSERLFQTYSSRGRHHSRYGGDTTFTNNLIKSEVLLLPTAGRTSRLWTWGRRGWDSLRSTPLRSRGSRGRSTSWDLWQRRSSTRLSSCWVRQ